MRPWALVAILGGALSAACGATSTVRMVDDPAGTAIEYGAPQNTVYAVELEAAKERSRITVFESSQCDVIPVTVMQRYEERVQGDEVIQRNPVSKTQVAGKPKSQIVCNQTYARGVEVLLEVDTARHSLGTTDQRGQVWANLAELFQSGAYEGTPAGARVILRPAQARPAVDAGILSLAELNKQQARIEELLGQLEAILAKGETGASAQEIVRSYELYAQLQVIGSGDPRVEGVAARFWELFYGRKQEEAREKLGRTLSALGEARETLKVMGDAAIPLYVQAAANSGELDARALEWSSLRLIRALRGAPTVCSAGFAWENVQSYGWPADARLAAQYVHFGYGTGHAAQVQSACRF